jgi:hypothetical protein
MNEFVIIEESQIAASLLVMFVVLILIVVTEEGVELLFVENSPLPALMFML